MKKLVRIFSWLSLFTPLSGREALADAATRARFLAEYPAASQRFESAYSRLRIVCDTRFSERLDPNHGPQGARYEYIVNGSKHRVDREYSGSGQFANQRSTFVINGDKSFTVDRNETGPSYRLRGMGGNVVSMSTLRWIFPPAFAAYCVSEDRVLDLLAKRGFAIEDAKSEGEGDAETVVVRWNWPWEGTGPATRRGEFRFRPSLNWALMSYHWRQQMPDKTWQLLEAYSEVNYQGDIAGVPLVSALEQGGKMDDSSKKNIESWRITSIGPAAAKEVEFTLAPFNLKYDQGIQARNYGWYLALIGAVGLVGSLAVRRWMNRRRVVLTA